jgi:gluconolactonase
MVQVELKITRKDDALGRIVPAGASIDHLWNGFIFTEGPVWRTRENDLIFSDIPANSLYRWTPDDKLHLFRKPSGYDKTDEPPNGRVTRLESDGSLTVLAARYDGKRLNSPNDLVHHSSGALFFTDPPYGFIGQDDDPKKELDFNGVFRLHNGELKLLYKAIRRPNGLAFSPDEKTFYLANSDAERKIWLRFDVGSDLSISNPTVFADVTSEQAGGLPDGMKIDREGNLYCTGPGGIWIFTAAGKHLGTLHFPEIPANLHWGDADAQMLYVTARTGLYRVKLNIPGIRP